MSEVVKVIIASHKRAETMTTHKVVANCAVCVEESQLAEYKKFNPDLEYITHPDNVIGLNPKIKWIHDKFPNVCILDDDFNAMQRTYVTTHSTKESRVSPDVAYDVIQVAACMAKQIGAKAFGFSNSARPVDFAPASPIQLKGFIQGGSIGLLEGFRLEFPEELHGNNDYFISGLNAYLYRIAWIDERYAFTSKEGTFKSVGGLADFRTLETEKQDYETLVKYFGNAIVKKAESTMRKLLHNYEKTLRLPW